jgi:hypothetical protein
MPAPSPKTEDIPPALRNLLHEDGMKKLFPKPRGRRPGSKNKPKPKERQEVIMEIQEATKVCRGQRCAHNGEAQPVSAFMRSKMSPDGYMHLCKECYKLQNRDRVGLKDKGQYTLQIRFDNHQAVLAALAKKAAEEMRTIEAQAIMLIKQAVLERVA